MEILLNNKVVQFINAVNDYRCKQIYIYGAGKIAHLLFNVCKNNGINITNFCVTDINNNVSNIDGIKVVQFDSTIFDFSNSLFIIGVLERGKCEINERLEKSGAKNILPLPDFVDSYVLDTYAYTHPVIEITTKIGCDNQCRFCPQNLLLKKYFNENQRRVSILSFDKYIYYLSKLPKDTLVIFAGFCEPFLNPEALHMMKYTVEKGFKLRLYTTFRGITYQDYLELKNIPFDYVCFHAPDENHYADIPITDEYLKIVEDAVNSKKHDGTPFIDHSNSQSVADPVIKEILKDKVYSSGVLYDWAGNITDDEGILLHTSLHGRVVCTRNQNTAFNILLPDGTVTLCCSDFGLRHVLGNLNDNSYEEIIHGDKLNNIRKAMNKCDDDSILCRKCMYAKEIKN